MDSARPLPRPVMITDKTRYKPLSFLGMIKHYEWMLDSGLIEPNGPAHGRLKELKQIYSEKKSKKRRINNEDCN